MIAGTGIDLVELGRVAKLLARHPAPERIYGPEERRLLSGRRSLGSWAAGFCAKEAFAKALGTGVRGFSLYEVQLLRGPAGEPYLRLSGRAQAIARARGLRFHVSVTHTRAYAAVVVIAEKEDSPCKSSAAPK